MSLRELLSYYEFLFSILILLVYLFSSNIWNWNSKPLTDMYPMPHLKWTSIILSLTLLVYVNWLGCSSFYSLSFFSESSLTSFSGDEFSDLDWENSSLYCSMSTLAYPNWVYTVTILRIRDYIFLNLAWTHRANQWKCLICSTECCVILYFCFNTIFKLRLNSIN